MKDYSCMKFTNYLNLRAIINEACAEAIADTRKAERRRAVRMLGVLVNMTACSCHASKRSHVEDMILGREKRRRAK